MPAQKITASGPVFQHDGPAQTLSERRGLKHEKDLPWDAKLVSRVTEHHGEYCPKSRQMINLVPIEVLVFERNEQRENGRADEHFSEVYRVVHGVLKTIPETTQLSIKLRDTHSGRTYYLPRDYAEKAYEVCTLRVFRKASPEVEKLIEETTTLVTGAPA